MERTSIALAAAPGGPGALCWLGATVSGLLTVVCQFCGAGMGTKDGQGKTGVSHGICPRCEPLSNDDQMRIYKDRQIGIRPDVGTKQATKRRDEHDH